MPNTNYYYQKREDPYKPKFTRNVNRPLTFFLVIVALVFIMSVFFKVSRIEVKGNSIYTADEVIKASGIETGDNLFFINGIAAGSRVAVKLPYVDSVQINRGLPNLCRGRAVVCKQQRKISEQYQCERQRAYRNDKRNKRERSCNGRAYKSCRRG